MGKNKTIGLGAVLALIAALLIPLAVTLTATTAGAAHCEESGNSQGGGDGHECETQCIDGVTTAQQNDCPPPPLPPGCNDGGSVPSGVTQGGQSCCNDNSNTPTTLGVTQGGRDVGCCPDGSPGGFQWGGYAGQNRYWCDAPPDTPPATAPPATEPPPTEPPPAVAPTTAPKKAAVAAKPAFTG
jgi:hypothetical protein